MAEYYFRLPRYEELSRSQRDAVKDNNPIALSGGPGTGKSCVSLWRHILNHRREGSPIRSQLLTFTTSLALYLKDCCRKESAIAARYVESSKKWIQNPRICPEIIHDEAQDLNLSYNTGLKNIQTVFHMVQMTSN
ncbi:MAG: hypothetical protein LUE98_09695 [Tannerellaceae bacterium]|nr:hypothetical protein [Tannerellaceae bacterium]